MQELKDAGVFVRIMHEAMLRAGIDTDAVYRWIGLNSEMLRKAELRTPHAAQPVYWEALAAVSGDPDVGLHLGEVMPLYRGQVLEYLFFSSPTFGEGLRRVIRYQRLLSDAAAIRLERDGVRAFVTFDIATRRDPVLRHQNENLALGFTRFFRFVTEDAFAPARITFWHDRPADTREHERIFACPIEFGAAENRLYFDSGLLAHPSPHADSELMELHEEVANRRMSRLASEDVVARVQRAIGEMLELRKADLAAVAGRLGMRPRDLQRELARADTNFNRLLNDFRADLARRLLVETDESMDRIVYLTGFSEPSTFYRAFKRWEGVTPIEYRQRERSAAGR